MEGVDEVVEEEVDEEEEEGRRDGEELDDDEGGGPSANTDMDTGRGKGAAGWLVVAERRGGRGWRGGRGGDRSEEGKPGKGNGSDENMMLGTRGGDRKGSCSISTLSTLCVRNNTPMMIGRSARWREMVIQPHPGDGGAIEKCW